MNAKIMGWMVFFVCVLLPVSWAFGQSGGDYDLSWSIIGSGGGTSSGGDFELTTTIGEPEAGASSGGDYELSGGFLPGVPLCMVDFYSFARFAEYWLDTPCNVGNDWCDGADLDHLDDVDWVDVELLADEWLYCCPSDWPLK